MYFLKNFLEKIRLFFKKLGGFCKRLGLKISESLQFFSKIQAKTEIKGRLRSFFKKVGLKISESFQFFSKIHIRIEVKDKIEPLKDETKPSRKKVDVLGRMKIKEFYDYKGIMWDERKVFHFPVEIAEDRLQHFYRPLRESSEEYLQVIGETGRKIVEGLFKIEGITQVFIHPYEMTIVKGECFSWDEEIIPEVKKLIKRVLQKQ